MSVIFQGMQVEGLTVDPGANEKVTVLRWNHIDLEAGLDEYEVYVTGPHIEPECYETKKDFIKIKKLAPGEYTFAVVALDKNDDETLLSQWVTFTVADITDPKKGKITVTQVEGDQDSIRIAMSNFTDAGGIAGYTIKVNGETVRDKNNPWTEDQYIYTKENLAGKITVEVTAVDNYGHESKAAKKNITIKDVTPPDQVIGVTVGSATEKLTTISWEEGTDNVGVVSYEVKIDGKTYKTKTNEINIKKLSAGEHTVSVIAYDKAKKASTPSVAETFFVADSTDPKAGKITITQTGDELDTLQITMTGFTDNLDKNLAYNIWINGVQVATEYSGTTFTRALDGLSGKVNVEVTAVDDNNNESKVAKKSIKLQSAPATEPAVDAKQYFGSKKFADKYDDYSNSEFDEILKTAVVSPLKTTDGDDFAQANATTFSYFQQGLDFGAGNDTLIIPKSKSCGAAGVWFNGDVNFGEGNNTLESYTCDGGFYADNLYFGNGNNTIISQDTEIRIGKLTYYDRDDEQESFPTDETGKIVFGDGKNNISIREWGEICGNAIQFGNGGNTVVLKDGGWLETESYFMDGEDPYSDWWDLIETHNGGITAIEFGTGADSITLTGKKAVNLDGYIDDDDWDNWSCLQTFELNMGGGNDKITVNKGGYVTMMSCLDDQNQQQGGNIFMGNGNDTVTINEGGCVDLYGTFDFGNGDDTLIINNGAEWDDIITSFGDGNDTLVLNGTMTIGNTWQLDIDTLENISGNGELIVYGFASDEFISRFESVGITVTLA